MISAPLQKLLKNVGDLGKLIVAKGFKKLRKVQKIANSGHTAGETNPSEEKMAFQTCCESPDHFSSKRQRSDCES